MDLTKQKKVYDLEYIQNIFKIVPLTFIVILTILSILTSYVVLESKQKRQIDLLYQKKSLYNEFSKKELLINFNTKVDKSLNKEILEVKKILQEHTYKIIGSLENTSKSLDLSKSIEFLKNYEKKNDINIILFEKNKSHILYGKDKLSFLCKLIFGEYNKNYEKIVLQYIQSQGKYNFQKWTNNLTAKVRTSFFDVLTLNGVEYYVGTFSKLKDLRKTIKDLFIYEINSLKNMDDYSIWFFDILQRKVYNFNKKKKYHDMDKLIFQEKNTLKYNILKYFNSFDPNKKSFDNYVLYNDKYKFLLAIDYKNNIAINKSIIEEKYFSLFLKITLYILIISIILMIFSLVFYKFTKKILNDYNKKLQDNTASLSHWKNRFELAIIASNDGLWDIDFETGEIYLSQKWLEITGYEKGEIKNFSHWFALIHPNDKKAIQNIFDDIFAEKRNDFLYEYRLKTKNHGFKWILGRGRLFLDKETKHKRMLMMSMDIDISKKMKKELLDVELLVEDGKIVIFKLFNDDNLSVKYISNAIKNYGYTKQMFENGEINFLNLVYKKDINIVKTAFNTALKKGLNDFTFVCRVLNSQNQIKWISCRTLILKGHLGNVINFYGYINDITKIKLSEEELKIRVEEELKNNRQKDRILIQQSKLAAMGEMLGNIAHQWRQPLNNVLLFLQFIRDNYKSEKPNEVLINKYFEKSFSQIQYMSQTIDDFRNFYKPSKQKTSFNIKYTINSSLEIIKAQLKYEDIKLILQMKDIQILNYENEFKQALLNIFSNALDAIREKRKKLSFDAYIKIEVEELEKSLLIKIENNGGQIPKDIIERIFEPYFTSKFEAQGTGIGLYMTKSIIEKNMNGKIEVFNIKDGVYFSISLALN